MKPATSVTAPPPTPTTTSICGESVCRKGVPGRHQNRGGFRRLAVGNLDAHDVDRDPDKAFSMSSTTSADRGLMHQGNPTHVGRNQSTQLGERANADEHLVGFVTVDHDAIDHLITSRDFGGDRRDRLARAVDGGGRDLLVQAVAWPPSTRAVAPADCRAAKDDRG